MKEKVAQLYQISPDLCMLMNCYVIKTVSGKVIVIDGGGVQTREETSGYLYEELKRICGKDVPEIEAWFLSHLHDDHVTEFCKIVNDENKPVSVKNVYFNFPDYKFFEQVEGGRFTYLYRDVESAYDKLFGVGAFAKCDGKTASEGDVIDIEGLKIKVLLVYSAELAPNCINDTSMIFSVEAGGQKILFLGDAFIAQGNQLLEKYGEKLESCIVQMSHHGQNGVTEEVYKAINPRFCLWSAPDWVFDNWNGNLNTFETRKWMENIGAKYHFITGRHKTQSVGLPVDFDSLCEEDISVIKK